MSLIQREQTDSGSAPLAVEATIHVVDGDYKVQQSIQSVVGTLGVSVRCHVSAEDFLENTEFDKPGCIIAEVHLSGMSGIDLQELLRKRGVRYPVIMLASQADVRLAVRAMALGAIDFMEKPFLNRALIARVKQALLSLP